MGNGSSSILNLDDEAVVRRVGALFRDWALNGLPDGGDPRKIKEHLEAAGLRFRPGIRKVKIRQNDDSVTHMAIPSAAQMKGMLDKLKSDYYSGGYKYKLPKTFEDYFQNGSNYNEKQLLDFYDFRLGDYVLQHCD